MDIIRVAGNRKRNRKFEIHTESVATEGSTVILPSTIVYVRKYVRKIGRRAERVGTPQTPQQMRILEVGLINAAIKVAKQEGQTRVNVRHAKKGVAGHGGGPGH